MSAPAVVDAVQERFAALPTDQRDRLLKIRSLIFDIAQKTPEIGRIEETLKWGQPSYLTAETRSGTTVRIDAHKGGGTALYVNCQTDLVDTFKTHYPALTYEGVRAVVFPPDAPLPEAQLQHIIALTLTYHARKRRKSA